MSQTLSSNPLPSYSSGPSTTPLLGMTIGEMLDRTAEKFPDNEALVCLHQDIRWTYKEFVAKVNQAARAFLTIGVKRGDRVGIWSPNRYEWTVTQFATAKIGAILVNINPAYGAHELEYAMNLSGISVLVTADRFKASDYRKTLYELAPELKASAAGKIKARRLENLRAVINMDTEQHAGMWSWDEFIGFSDQVEQQEVDKVQNQLQFDDPINIQFTSGTTGSPKGATLTHHNILNNGFFVGESQRLSEKDRLVIPVPLYHCFGMVMGNLGCVTHGSTMIYPGEGFEPKAVLQAVHQEKATALYGVPTMFIAELAEPEFDTYDLSTLHTGDLANMDEDGYIQIVGRIKDMVIRGGENIYPKEVEEFLYTHPSIEEIQVTGVPDEKFGEELVAWVKLRPDANPVDADDLIAFCKGKIAHYKIPRNYKFVEAFPMTVTGKIQKFKMREMSIEEMGLKK